MGGWQECANSGTWVASSTVRDMPGIWLASSMVEIGHKAFKKSISCCSVQITTLSDHVRWTTT